MVLEGEEISDKGLQLLSKRKALLYCLDALKSCGVIYEKLSLNEPWFTNDTFTHLDASFSSQQNVELSESFSLSTSAQDSSKEKEDQTLGKESLLNANPWKVASMIQRIRDEALREFQCSLVQRHNCCEPLSRIVQSCVDSIEWNGPDQINTLSFKLTYIYRNIPCIIKDLDRCEFTKVTSFWTKRKVVDKCRDVHTQVDTDWFFTLLGEEALVPIRSYLSIDSPHIRAPLDQAGRAEECNTTNISMRSWVDLLCTTLSSMNSSEDPNIYLKDWHLQKQWESFHHNEELYTTPEIFQYDLLNDYLIRFTDGDYRFVYWGPSGSRTYLHSDVMNSFSWSYNVSGEKEWTFYLPEHHDVANNHPESFKIVQKSGETVFVPAGWKHEVRNLMETISINHNWIVPVSLDLTWACMLDEIQAVEQEMISWGMNSYEIRESMLSGCFGLDLSTFFLVILVGMIHRMISLQLLPIHTDGYSYSLHSWEAWFDLACMISTMNSMMNDCSSNHITSLSCRLEATLGDKIMASNTLYLYCFLRSLCLEQYKAYTLHIQENN